jgi:isoleucyl-tRNA synthetase
MTQEQIRSLEAIGRIDILVDGELVEILRDEVEVQSEDVQGWMVASRGVLTVALDVSMTPELEMEGNARELVNRIQKLRKDLNLELTDRIIVEIQSDSELDPAFTQFNPYICAEILADHILLKHGLSEGIDTEINGKTLKINLITKE